MRDMIFEDDFPSLKGTEVTRQDCKDNYKFLFGYLFNEKEDYYFHQLIVKQNCLDKVRVREAWTKFKESLNEADIIVNCDWIKDDIKQFEKNLYIAEK